MEQHFGFSATAGALVSAPQATNRGLGAHYARVGGTVPYDIQHAAAVDLEHEAKELPFNTGKSYEEASRHLMSRDAWLAMATAAIAENADCAARALGIEIVAVGRRMSAEQQQQAMALSALAAQSEYEIGNEGTCFSHRAYRCDPCAQACGLNMD